LSAVAHIDEYKTGRFFSADFRGDMSWNGYENKVLLRNEGNGPDGLPRFLDVAMAVGADLLQDARGYAAFDFDHDGDLDLVLNHSEGDSGRAELAHARLLRNDLGSRHPWLVVEVQGTESNRDGIGAVVTVETAGRRQIRRAEAGSGYASQHSARLHFGLGGEEAIERLTVRWPSGLEETYDEAIAARQRIRLIEGRGYTLAPLPGRSDRDRASLSASLASDEAMETENERNVEESR
jgi:hypothetical protein